MRHRVIHLCQMRSPAGSLGLLLPCLLFTLHALLFRGWIVDDAGISFAYARNLQEGYGLVSQPGLPPVEGYSNFLWTVLFVPFFGLGLFHPIVTPKLLSLVLVILAFIVIHRSIASWSPGGYLTSSVALSLLAMNTSFVVWTTSGLENPLYIALLCLMVARSARSLTADQMDRRDAAILGLLAGAVALTRPDGIAFCVAYPLLLMPVWLIGSRADRRAVLQSLLSYGLCFAATFGSYLVFRFTYFGSLMPNTYYAKGGPCVGDLIPLLTLEPTDLARLQRLMTSVAGPEGTLLLVGLLVITTYLASVQRFRREQFVLLVFLAVSACVYLLLPEDWMAEYRFATPFFVFFYVYAATGAAAVILPLRLPYRSKTFVLAGIAVLAIAISIDIFSERSARFAENPTLSFNRVAEQFGERFNRYAALLDTSSASVLLPDLGGTLYYSRLRVFDLAGLCDSVIAKTMRKDQHAFYDYVFEVARPTFIHTHDYWTRTARFEEDARFRRDYVAIFEGSDRSVENGRGPDTHSCDYVRRDAVGNKLSRVRQLAQELARPSSRRLLAARQD